MLERIGDGIWWSHTEEPGPSVCLSFGVHGNERPPIDAGLRVVAELEGGRLELQAGRLLLVHANTLASEQDERWSEGGVDLNRCFHTDVLAREPRLFEERRAREIVAALEEREVEVLVDFHCTVEPGRRFLMQHPPISHAGSRRVWSLLRAPTLLSDPQLNFGAVSLDEWMSTRGRVGICYETGWIQDPENTADSVYSEMRNVLAGLGLVDGPVEHHGEKELLELDDVVECVEEGFAWSEGIGENLQALPAGTVLGSYPGGRELVLAEDAVLIFPKKRPELVRIGAPLVYLGVRG